MNTYSNALLPKLDFKKMLSLIGKFDEEQRERDAMRDAVFAGLREQGTYIKAEKDRRGEFWVIGDEVLERIEKVQPQIKELVPPLGGVRVVALSDWLQRQMEAIV